MRANLSWRLDLLYMKSEKLRAIVTRESAKKILFSEKPEWADEIRRGFWRMPHQVDFGKITEDSYRRYDIVVPLSLSELEVARRHCPPENCALPLPSAGAVKLCEDKYEFNRVLIKAGFGRYIPTMGAGLATPYILKKRIGEWGKDCYLILNSSDEEKHLHLIQDPRYFCQQMVLGTREFATHILFTGGKIVKALNIRYEFTGAAPIKGQDKELFQTISGCPYLGLFARILRTIEYEGLCCVNYKVANGEPLLLEINPRFGGSLAPYFFSFVRHLR